MGTAPTEIATPLSENGVPILPRYHSTRKHKALFRKWGHYQGTAPTKVTIPAKNNFRPIASPRNSSRNFPQVSTNRKTSQIAWGC